MILDPADLRALAAGDIQASDYPYIQDWLCRCADHVEFGNDHYVLRPIKGPPGAQRGAEWFDLGAPGEYPQRWPCDCSNSLYILLTALQQPTGVPYDGKALLSPGATGDPCGALRGHIKRAIAWIADHCEPLAEALGATWDGTGDKLVMKPQFRITRDGYITYTGKHQVLTT